MDFYRIKARGVKKNGINVIEVYPDFVVGRSQDLMVRGKSFVAVWDEASGLWSTDEYDVQRLVDEGLYSYIQNHPELNDKGEVHVKYMSDFSSGSWKSFRNFLLHISDNAQPLNDYIVFANNEVKRSDYISHTLDYPLLDGEINAYEELIDTLYTPGERMKIEWAIGAVISGDARRIEKFIALYGAPGTGKGTIIRLIQKLFPGYWTAFDAKALGSSQNAFASEVFKNNPLIAFDHDTDMSRIEDNTKLNSIISHEDMVINEKNKPMYTAHVNAFLFVGTNKPVKITDAQSGIIRRLIDVHPSGITIPPKTYQLLWSRLEFELGAIAFHCLKVYRRLGKDYYSNYRSIDMMLKTDVFFNFLEYYYDIFNAQEGVTLKQAWEMFKNYCEESNLQNYMPMHKFREELKNYYNNFADRAMVNDVPVRSYYSNFKKEKFSSGRLRQDNSVNSLVLDSPVSLLDKVLADEPAQYATKYGTPKQRWGLVSTKLRDLDTRQVHYTKVPANHIVIDFDLKDERGEKDPELNLEAASKWPATYAEWSKGGNGIHLHYIWTGGDVTELAPIYAPDIEVKVFTGDSSLRRKVSLCNDIPIAELKSGLPFKEKNVYDSDRMMTERGMRALIERNLRKEIHPGTKPSIDFIAHIFEDAQAQGLEYDLRDMRPKILSFALNSTNQSSQCVSIVSKIKFSTSDDILGEEEVEEVDLPLQIDDSPIVFFDVEVYPNLFYISWKAAGDEKELVHMFNPSPEEVERLAQFKLVGFNNRHYDNHILYARIMGYTNEQLYNLSQRIISNESKNAAFAAAYSLSFADLYDITTKKQSLKKWEIELGVPHKEMEIPWDEPVPEELWDSVAEYCDNDVMALEAVWNARAQDVAAREILASISGLSMNDTTRAHTAKIIFGQDFRRPQGKFVYTDLSEMFPGYIHEWGKSTYRDELVGEGGYVYAEPGIYDDVTVLDIASMHPTSISNLNLFGVYTPNFEELTEARLAIKHKDFDKAKTFFDGKLSPYLQDESGANALAYALKIVINSVYGLTSAKFPNPFRDERNVDNIVAKRGALFMIDLKHEVQKRGFTVAHIKTDSIKIPKATAEIIDFVISFGEKYGYTFEIEHGSPYRKMCLVNDAVYIAQESTGEWTAVGAQFKHSYVFKFLFSGEPIVFADYCETKAVTTALYLDMNEKLPENEHEYRFVGKVGSFVPILPGHGGGLLLRQDKTDKTKFHAASGTTGFRWLEAQIVKDLGLEDAIDTRYFEHLATDAMEAISKYGDFEAFVSSSPEQVDIGVIVES